MGHGSQTEPSQTKPRNFTLVVLDLDDTCIPTTIRNSLRYNYGFDLFNFANTKQLQSDIINSMEQIKLSLKKYIPRQEIRFVFVSNATKQWIQDMLVYNPKFPILATYLRNRDISSLSAEQSAHNYLNHKFGPSKAAHIIASTFNSDKGQNRFMYKYTTFGMVIQEYETKYNLKCTQLISIGDGLHEHQSTQLFTQRNKHIIGINIRLKQAPTIKQLESEWNFIRTCFDGVIKRILESSVNGKNYFEINIDQRFKNDNNILCTGKGQLSAIAIYFDLFMKLVCQSNESIKRSAMKAVCQIVMANVSRNDGSSPKGIQMKEMLRIAAMNEEFNKSISEMRLNNSVFMSVQTQ